MYKNKFVEMWISCETFSQTPKIKGFVKLCKLFNNKLLPKCVYN